MLHTTDTRTSQTERRQGQIAAHEMGKTLIAFSVLLVFSTDFSANNFSLPHSMLNLWVVLTTLGCAGGSPYRQNNWVALDREYQVAHRWLPVALHQSVHHPPFPLCTRFTSWTAVIGGSGLSTLGGCAAAI